MKKESRTEDLSGTTNFTHDDGQLGRNVQWLTTMRRRVNIKTKLHINDKSKTQRQIYKAQQESAI
jgi:hypothetical protein